LADKYLCSVCVRAEEQGVTPDASKSKTFWAELLDVSEASVRRHFKHGPEPRLKVDEVAKSPAARASYDTDYNGNIQITKTADRIIPLSEWLEDLAKDGLDPADFTTSHGHSVWLQSSKAGEKTLYANRFRAVRKTPLRESAPDIEELLALVGSWEPAPAAENTNPFTLVVCPSDQQVGKVDWNGGAEDTIRRVRASYHRAAEIAKRLRPNEIVIAELGDSIENIYSVSSQRGTNDLSLTEQIRVARRLALEGVKLLAPHTDKLRFCAVPSNHGSVRIGPKSPENHVLDDYGIEIAEQLRDVFAESWLGDKCTVEIPEFNHESMCIESNGTKIGMVHGHQSKGADRIGDWWKGQSHGRMPVGQADILLAGHWHSLRVQQSGDARWLMVSPASDNGSSWFTNNTGERSVSGMLTFTTSGGSWDNLKVV
jgi:hypothetical protein